MVWPPGPCSAEAEARACAHVLCSPLVAGPPLAMFSLSTGLGLCPGSYSLRCLVRVLTSAWILFAPYLRAASSFPHPHYLMVGLPLQVIWAPKLYPHVHFLVQFQILSLFEPLRSVFLVLAAQESQMEEIKKNTRTWCLPRPFKTNSLGMGAGLLYILKAPLLI